jgi:hypothetical protein
MGHEEKLVVLADHPTEPIVTHEPSRLPRVSQDIYHEIASAVNQGAFAVIVVSFVVVWFTRNFFKKAVDSYGELMGTLKQSVANNSKAIDRMADAQTRLADIMFEFKHSPYGERIIRELEKQANELRHLNGDDTDTK